MKRNEPGLIYHSLHSRRGVRGCFPVAFLLSALVMTGLLMVIDVRMPERVHSKGVGRLDFRNDTLIHFQIRQRSPLLLNMPAYVDPARQEPAAAVVQNGRADAALMPAPRFDFLNTPPDSAVLSDDDLLAMPPLQEPAPAEAAEPATTPTGEEVQP